MWNFQFETDGQLAHQDPAGTSSAFFCEYTRHSTTQSCIDSLTQPKRTRGSVSSVTLHNHHRHPLPSSSPHLNFHHRRYVFKFIIFARGLKLSSLLFLAVCIKMTAFTLLTPGETRVNVPVYPIKMLVSAYKERSSLL